MLSLRFNGQRKHIQAAQHRMLAALGLDHLLVDSPHIDLLAQAFDNFVAALVARRLIQNNRSQDLIRADDFEPLHRYTMPIIARFLGDSLTKEELEEVVSLLQRFMQNMIDSMKLIRKAGVDPYDENWKYIDAMVVIATERNVTLKTLFSSMEGFDALVRHFTSEAEYLANARYAVEQLEQQFGSIPLEVRARIRRVTDKITAEEVARIYGNKRIVG
jgi:hypothetical protein